MVLEKNQYNQAKCEHCGSWHFAIYLDENYKPNGEIKCCKCQRFFRTDDGVVIDTPEDLKEVEDKNRSKD